MQRHLLVEVNPDQHLRVLSLQEAGSLRRHLRVLSLDQHLRVLSLHRHLRVAVSLRGARALVQRDCLLATGNSRIIIVILIIR